MAGRYNTVTNVNKIFFQCQLLANSAMDQDMMPHFWNVKKNLPQFANAEFESKEC